MRLAVQILAWIYLVLGLAAGFHAVYPILFGGRGDDWGGVVLVLLLGYGLLKFHSLARGIILLLSWFSLISGIAGLALGIGHLAGLSIASGGLIVDHPVLAFLALGIGLAFTCGQIWLFTRPEVVALFKGSGGGPGNSSATPPN